MRIFKSGLLNNVLVNGRSGWVYWLACLKLRNDARASARAYIWACAAVGLCGIRMSEKGKGEGNLSGGESSRLEGEYGGTQDEGSRNREEWPRNSSNVAQSIGLPLSLHEIYDFC